MKKKILFALAILFAVVLLVGGWFKIRLNGMYKALNAESIETIDLTSIENGVYSGAAGEFVVSVNLTVTIHNHEITDIQILEQSSGTGYEATEIIGSIIEAQSPDVDVITGATGSSRCIMIAVQKALTQ